MPEKEENKKLKVINIGISNFYDSLEKQHAKVVQIDWQPPVKHTKEIEDLLDALL
ncbi:MAG: hypothetical protein II161_06730 [Erysipelotrichaceae bacterium]|jgi:hypothetical protein|nr:hypothetical protein [Erysipelotrichaceae bacterium]